MVITPRADAGLARRAVTLAAGLAAVALGVAVMIECRVGVAPYDVLNTGLAELTGLRIGLAAMVTPAAFVLVGSLLGHRPGPGTLVAVLLVGPLLDLALHVLPELDSLGARWVAFALATLLLGAGITTVIIAGLGPGPAELVMLALHGRGFPLAPVRTAVELTCVALGWAMGGQVGAGTIAFALTIGPILRHMLRLAGFTGPLDVAADAAAPGA